MPTATDYSQAIQNLRVAVHDEELKAGEVAVDPMGLPLQYAGNFAVVFQVHCPQTRKTWAVKCFTKDVDHRDERYDAISQHLKQVKLPFMVGFEYQETGILVSGRWYPIVKMDWVEGEALNRFVAANLDKPGTLRQLLGLWRKLAERLREAEVTHADLQHGNVLLVPAKDREGHRLMLVDYDGMYVPALARQSSGELGHPAYQHPERLRDGVYSSEVDRFSHLAIYAAIRCLSLGKRGLWTRFDNGDNLLFREADFRSPGKSELFQELWALGDPEAHALIGRLILATQASLDRVPLLTEVLSNGTVQPLGHDQERQVKALMGGGTPKERAVSRFTPEDFDSWLQPLPSEERPAEPLSPAELASSWGSVSPQAPSPSMPRAEPPIVPPAHQVSAYSKLCSELSAKDRPRDNLPLPSAESVGVRGNRLDKLGGSSSADAEAAAGTPPTGPAAPESLQVRIVAILRAHRGENGLYVSPEIPTLTVFNAVKSCSLPPNDTVLGVIDCTLSGSGSAALVFGKHGFYYHNLGSMPDPGFVPYREFPEISFGTARPYCIALGGDRYCNKTGSRLSRGEIIRILNAVKRAVIECNDTSRAEGGAGL